MEFIVVRKSKVNVYPGERLSDLDRTDTGQSINNRGPKFIVVAT